MSTDTATTASLTIAQRRILDLVTDRPQTCAAIRSAAGLPRTTRALVATARVLEDLMALGLVERRALATSSTFRRVAQ